eukprot:symbB.v1.2.005068.t1/scaffold292.1/size239810/12
MAKLSYGKALLVSSLAPSHGGQVAGASQLGKMLEPGGRFDGFDMNELRQKNRLRLLQHRRRRALNALKRAKQRSAAKGIVLDEQAFLVQWQESQGEINSDSTASTTSSDSDSSETSASS